MSKNPLSIFNLQITRLNPTMLLQFLFIPLLYCVGFTQGFIWCVWVHMCLSPVVSISEDLLWKKCPSLPRKVTFFFIIIQAVSLELQPLHSHMLMTKRTQNNYLRKYEGLKKKYTVRRKKNPESKDQTPFKLIL